MCFFYLLLGHLMGDFLLQTNKIAYNKLIDYRWNVLHSIVVTICMLLLAYPFGIAVVLLVIANGVLHYFTDFYKPKISYKYPLPGLVYFLIDQGVHAFIIYIIALFASKPIFLLITPAMVKISIVIIFVSSFTSVLNQYILNLIFPNMHKKFFEESEKSVGNLARTAIALALYFAYTRSPLFLLGIVATAVVVMLYFLRKWHAWMSWRYFIVKVILGLVAALAGFAFLVCF